jgi:hypothetical protein
MISEKIHSFRNISEMQKALDDNINALKKRSDELSNTIGEKLRVTESSDAADLQEFKNRMVGETNDPKKKTAKSTTKSTTKTTKKKDQKSNWHNLDSISIYDGLGAKGELEIYFKALEQTKAELEKITKIKESIDKLSNKGLKDDLGCMLVLNPDLPAEIAFRKIPEHKKFTFKAIFTVPSEEINVGQI